MISIILFIFLIALFLIHYKIKFSYWKRKGISGPTPLPIFGTLLSENLFVSRNREWEYYHKYGPVFGTFSSTQPYFNTSDPDHIKEVLNQDEIFHSEASFFFNDEYLQNSLIFKNGFEWKQARIAMSHYFTSLTLRKLMGHYELVSNNFLKNLESIRQKSGDLIDFKFLTSCYGIDMIAKVILAIDIDSYKEKDSEFVKLAQRINEINTFQFILIKFLPRAIVDYFEINAFSIEVSNRLGDLFKSILKDRKEKGIKYNDLAEQIQEQVKAKNLNLSENAVIGNTILSFFAGVSNISDNLCNLFMNLVDHPQIKDKLYQEIKKEFSNEITYESLMENAYLDCVFKENLRLSGTISVLERTAVEDTKIGSFEIEKGTGVQLIFTISQTHPDNFKDPYKFNPDRYLDKSASNEDRIDLFWSFGIGNKNCIGMRLAIIEIKYLIVKILLNYDVYRTKDCQNQKIFVRGFTSNEKVSLCFKKRD